MVYPFSESNAPVENVDILGHIAHELRQPLSTIESIAYYLELVLQREQESDVHQQVVKLQRLVEQSNWIVSNAVYFAQASPPVPEHLDLKETISGCAAEYAFSGGPRIELRLAETLPLVWMDPGQAQHLMRNLIRFFGAVSDCGHAMVLTASATHVEVLVEIAATVLASAGRKFESIFDGCGADLSLASVRRIVDAHHGRIRVLADSSLGVSAVIAFPIA